MDKIVIIGSPGAGKSTFARALGELLHIEVFHLDRYFWQPGWKELPREDRIELQQQLVKDKAQWIMEGTYLDSSDMRLNAADAIIFLDMPRLLCLWRIIKRHMKTHHQQGRPDIPEGCTDKLSLRCILKVLVFPHRGRQQLLKKMRSICMSVANQPEQKTIFHFHSTSDLEAFLYGLSFHNKKAPAPQHNAVVRKKLTASVLEYPGHLWSLCCSTTHNIRHSPLMIEPLKHSARTRTN